MFCIVLAVHTHCSMRKKLNTLQLSNSNGFYKKTVVFPIIWMPYFKRIVRTTVRVLNAKPNWWLICPFVKLFHYFWTKPGSCYYFTQKKICYHKHDNLQEHFSSFFTSCDTFRILYSQGSWQYSISSPIVQITDLLRDQFTAPVSSVQVAWPIYRYSYRYSISCPYRFMK